jgi:hypothetical protein
MWRLVKYKILVPKLETTHSPNVIGRLVGKMLITEKLKK